MQFTENKVTASREYKKPGVTPSDPKLGDRQLGVLAKHWTSGNVKTRLIPTYSADESAVLHRLFLETTLHRFAHLADHRVLSFTPEFYRSSFAEIATNQWDVLPQKGNDLGERMTNYFHEAFVSGKERVLLIGADTPHLPAVYIEAAFTALGQCDLVFVASDDGGYCLVGASRPVDPLMIGIDWGSSSVWEQTKTKIRALQWSQLQLPPWYDIDRPEDVTRLLEDLANHPDLKHAVRDPYLSTLREKLKKIHR